MKKANEEDAATELNLRAGTNIDLDKGRSVVAGNENQYATYFQYAFRIAADDIILGAGINKSEIDRTYIGYIGKICENFRATISVGYTQRDIESLLGSGETLKKWSVFVKIIKADNICASARTIVS